MAVSILSVSLAALLAGLITFVYKLITIRSHFAKLRKNGLPMPPHHPLLGHLGVVNGVLSKLPWDAHGQYGASLLQRADPSLGSIIYLDTWPFSPPILWVMSPEALHQVTTTHSLPKHAGMKRVLTPLAGEDNMLTLEGSAWKAWRTVFNPGFSPNHLMTQVPEIVEETEVFRDILAENADRGEILRMETLTIRLTLDIIGRITTDTKFKSQRTECELLTAMDNLLPWLTTGVEKNPLTLINPVRFFSYWYYSRQMRNFLSKKLDYRLAYHQEMGTMPGKSVVDLALKAHLEENNKTYGQEPLDPTLKMFIMNQINVFIFAGHDTTSSTICYIYYLLASNPECLELVRAEYDTIFGKDLSTTASQIKSNPRILNNLSYSLAVIKEAMRLFPTSASIRQGQPGISITDEKNRSFPTEYCMVFCFHQGIGRNADLWPEPDKFIPGRFLVGPEDPLYPVKGAWRPFEIGPRECIGQELTMLELKTAMALTIREFDIKAAYDELDQLNPPKGPVTVNGERMYQIIRGAAHPVDGFPCRVTKTTR